MKPVSILACSFALTWTSAAAAQRSEDAIRFLNTAIEAHQPAGTKLKARLTYSGTSVIPTQSLAPLGPHESFPLRRVFAVDEAAGTSVFDDFQAIAGLDLPSKTINTPAGGHRIDPLSNSYTAASSPPSAYSTLLPHFRLKTIRDTATRLQLASGPTPRIDYTMPNGSSGTLSFEPATKLLASIENAPSDGMYGQERTVLTYPGYRRVTGTAVPEAYFSRTKNAVLAPQEFGAKLSSVELNGPTPEELARPANLKLTDYSWRKPAFTVDTLAPGVHLISNVTASTDQWSYNVLAVEFADHIMVAEAPVSSEVNEKVLAKLAELAPGKPARHLILSHHHGDHIGGIEPYIDRGINLITTEDNATLLKRIAAVRGADFGSPKLEVVSDRRILKDASNEAHIYQMGRNPHTNQMLVVHLPRQGIIYQVDFVNDGEYIRNGNTDTFLKWMRDKKLKVERIAGLHGQTVDRSAKSYN